MRGLNSDDTYIEQIYLEDTFYPSIPVFCSNLMKRPQMIVEFTQYS